MNAVSSNSPRLSLASIIEAAIAMIRADGFDALSMRKLAQRCGVGAMTLYGYVQTKDELLSAIAEQFLSQLHFSAGSLPRQGQVEEIFRAVRRLLLQHPELAEIVARQHLNATSAFRGAEPAFAAMHQAGLGPEDAMSAFIALTAFTAGFAQREGHLDRNPAIHARRLAKLRELPPDEFRHVSELEALFGTQLDRDFEEGLDLLVRGIASKAHDCEQSR